VCPNYRITDWTKAKVVWLDQDHLDCAGCGQLRKHPRLYTGCDREEIYCMKGITEKMVLEKFFDGNFGEITKPLDPSRIFSYAPDAFPIVQEIECIDKQIIQPNTKEYRERLYSQIKNFREVNSPFGYTA